ncbi:MAG: terpene cyclase/mutase family protein [Planctomycetes bacterium]|nr:terpene cyclase/mutase family protein [Planctomycetota bacterium]
MLRTVLRLVVSTVVLAAVAVAQASELNVAGEIQSSVRALRATQDQVTGAYGGGVAGTAWALRAFAECPDRYRPGDGPFVRRAMEFLVSKQNRAGSIADTDANGQVQDEQTRLATAALTALADGSVQKALAHALEHLGKDGLKGPGWDAEGEPESAEQGLATATALLAKRGADKLFDGPRGKVIETANAIITLSSCERVISKSKKKAEPKPTNSLPPFAPADRAAALAAIDSGAKFLASAGPDGKFGAPGAPDAGISAMCLAALLSAPAPRDAKVQASIDDGLKWLVSLQKPDGAIHDGKLANYVTSASLMALSRAKRPGDKEVIARARGFLQTLQADEGDGYSEGDRYYGGIGYGSTERPDLSNLQMALEALHDSGLSKDDPTFQKAIRFLQRCQNRSETNDVSIVDGKLTIVAGDDGGASYAPGDSKAGFVELPDGRKLPRSYGSMTYALLKCMVFAGLGKDDPRVQAAFAWCRTNYTLDVNPGFVSGVDPTAAYQGLFYYFHTMARALDAVGEETIVDGAGKSHPWRAELCGRLVSMQSKLDKSWVNTNSPRWYEGNPLLATSYALLALEAALPKAP